MPQGFWFKFGDTMMLEIGIVLGSPEILTYRLEQDMYSS